MTTIKMELSITVDLNGEEPNVITRNIHHLVDEARANGQITGLSKAELEGLEIKLSDITPAA